MEENTESGDKLAPRGSQVSQLRKKISALVYTTNGYGDARKHRPNLPICPMAKSGPKLRPLIARVREKIIGQPDLAPALESYPDLVSEHWIWSGNLPAQIYERGSTRQVVRALIELACEEHLHEAWVPRRTCPCTHCVNPTHYDLAPYRMNKYGEPPPLPLRLRAAPETLSEIDEVANLIDECWPQPTPEEFKLKYALLGIHFSDEVVRQAFEKARSPGLALS